MTKKELRKWMRQYVMAAINKEEAMANRDLITVKDNKITDISNIVAIQLKDYITKTATIKVGVDTSNMALNEFKREFIDSEEEFKTTIMYGLLTQKDVFRGSNDKDTDEYVLGLDKKGGFKMATTGLDAILQEELVDASEELETFINAEIEKEAERIKWARSTANVKEFTAKREKVSIGRLSHTGFPTVPQTRTGAVPPANKSLKWLWWATKKEMDAEFSKLEEGIRARMIERVEQVAGGYGVKLISMQDIKGDYELLTSKLRAAQLDAKEKGYVTEGLKDATKQIQDFKGFVQQMARVHSDSAIKSYLDAIKSYESNNKKSTRGLITAGVVRGAKYFEDRRRELLEVYWGSYKNKEGKVMGDNRLAQRDLEISRKGVLYKKVDETVYFETTSGKYRHGDDFQKEYKVKDKKTGKEVTKTRQLKRIEYSKWMGKEHKEFRKFYWRNKTQIDKLRREIAHTSYDVRKQVIKGGYMHLKSEALYSTIKELRNLETRDQRRLRWKKDDKFKLERYERNRLYREYKLRAKTKDVEFLRGIGVVRDRLGFNTVARFFINPTSRLARTFERVDRLKASIEKQRNVRPRSELQKLNSLYKTLVKKFKMGDSSPHHASYIRKIASDIRTIKAEAYKEKKRKAEARNIVKEIKSTGKQVLHYAKDAMKRYKKKKKG